MTFLLIRRLWWWGVKTTSVYIETPSLEKLPSKAKDRNLDVRHGYSPPDANPVFQYNGVIIIIVIIVIIAINLTLTLLPASFILQFTTFKLGPKVQLAPPTVNICGKA